MYAYNVIPSHIWVIPYLDMYTQIWHTYKSVHIELSLPKPVHIIFRCQWSLLYVNSISIYTIRVVQNFTNIKPKLALAHTPLNFFRFSIFHLFFASLAANLFFHIYLTSFLVLLNERVSFYAICMYLLNFGSIKWLCFYL